jgi:replicative superfamily II helicase
MKKSKILMTTAAALLLFSSSPTFAENKAKKEPQVLTAEEQIKLEEIEARILEIREMELSKLEKAEKSEIKAELKSLEKEARALGGSGLYLSTGALIIIIILLIILL